MAQLSHKLADIRRRLTDNIEEEQKLVRGLDAALNHVDETLLAEIRHITLQHEARRAVIMNELQLLASRLCALPISDSDTAPAIEDGSHYAPISDPTGRSAHAPGNWRMAAQNIEDDLDFYTDPAHPSH